MNFQKGSSKIIQSERGSHMLASPLGGTISISQCFMSNNNSANILSSLKSSSLETNQSYQNSLQTSIISSSQKKGRSSAMRGIPVMTRNKFPLIGIAQNGTKNNFQEQYDDSKCFPFDIQKKSENQSNNKVTAQHTMVYKQKVLKQNLVTKMKLFKAKIATNNPIFMTPNITNKVQNEQQPNALLVCGQNNRNPTLQSEQIQTNNFMNNSNIFSAPKASSITPKPHSKKLKAQQSNGRQTQLSQLNNHTFNFVSKEDQQKYLQSSSNYLNHKISSSLGKKNSSLEVKGANGAQLQQMQSQQQLQQQILLLQQTQDTQFAIKQEEDQSTLKAGRGKKGVTFRESNKQKEDQLTINVVENQKNSEPIKNEVFNYQYKKSNSLKYNDSIWNEGNEDSLDDEELKILMLGENEVSSNNQNEVETIDFKIQMQKQAKKAIQTFAIKGKSESNQPQISIPTESSQIKLGNSKKNISLIAQGQYENSKRSRTNVHNENILSNKLDASKMISSNHLAYYKGRLEGVIIQYFQSINKIQINQGDKSFSIDIYPEDTCNGKYSWKISDVMLGLGSQGKVYKAFCSKHVKDYALKVIEVKGNFEGEEALNAIAEINVLKKIKGLNCALQISDFFGLQQMESKKIVIVMEYCQCNLREILLHRKQHKKPWTEQEAMLIFKQLLEANDAIRQKEVCHRDLKIQNILFSAKENRFKLGDFSEAKVLARDDILDVLPNESGKVDASYDENNFEEHSFRGTWKYLSPELSLALKENRSICQYNPFSSDLFSLGVLFSDLLSLEEIKYTQIITNEKQDSAGNSDKGRTNKAFINNIKIFCSSQTAKQQYPHACQLILALLSELPSQRKSYKKILTAYQLQTDLFHIELQTDKEIALTIEMQRESHLTVSIFSKAKKLFSIAEGYEDIFMFEKAIEIYSQTLQIVTTKNTAGLRSRILFSIGRCYEKLNHYDKSLEYYKQCYYFRKECYKPESRHLGEVLNALGIANQKLGNFNESQELYEESLKIAVSQHGEENILVANMYNNLGSIQCSLKQYEKGIEYFEKAIFILNKINQTKKVSEVLSNLSVKIFWITKNNSVFYQQVYLKLGDAKRSEEYQKSALSQAQKSFGENSIQLIDIYINLGQLFNESASQKYKQTSQIHEINESNAQRSNLMQTSEVSKEDREEKLMKAVNYYLIAERLIIQYYGESSVQLGELYNSIGQTFNSLKDQNQALSNFLKSEQAFVNSKKENTLWKTYSNLGQLYSSQKIYDKAEQYYKQALEIMEKINFDEIKKADVNYNIGCILLFQNNDEECISWLSKALSIYKNNNESHQNIPIIEKILAKKTK